MDPVFLIPIVVFLCSAALSFVLGRVTGGWSVSIGVGIWTVLAGGLSFELMNASGYDGLGILILLILGVAPAAAGHLVGGLWGWLRRPAPVPAV